MLILKYLLFEFSLIVLFYHPMAARTNHVDLDNNNNKNSGNNLDSHSFSIITNKPNEHLPHGAHKHHNKNTTENRQPSKNQRNSKIENEDDLLVSTGSGLVRGRAFYLNGQLQEINHPSQARRPIRVNAWMGIPFAEKPLGDLRFKRPVPIKNWEGVLNATELPNSCYQLHDTVISDFEGVELWNANTKIDEDCLYLNIWAPHPMPKTSPVMVRL